MLGRWRIRKGDKVCLLSGKDKGKQGAVLKVVRKSDRVFVEDVNMVTRHQKPNAAFPEGGKISKEASIHVSNLAFVDPSDGKPTRIGVKIMDDGKKVRFAKRSGKVIDG